MSRNPKVDDMKARQQINRILLTLNKSDNNISINSIIREITLQYPVSPIMIRRYIKEYYIDENIITEQEGILYGKK